MRATYSASICGTHHIFLRRGLISFSARRRRTVSRETLWCSVSLTSSSASRSSVQRARPAGGFAQAVATNSASSLSVSLRSAPRTRLFAQRLLQVAFDKASLGPVHGRPANPDAHGDIVVARPRVPRQQNLSPFELPCRVLTPAQKRAKFVALVLGQLDTIAYIHLCLLMDRGTDEQLNRMAGVSRSGKAFTPKQGQYLAFIHLYTRLHRRPPAETDMQEYFRVSPPSVHQMMLTLERAGLIRRQPRTPRSIELLVDPKQLPELL
jgi:hypothetical protein